MAPLPLTPLPKAQVALPLPSQQPVPSHPNPCLSRQEGYDPSMMIRSHCLHPNFMKGYHPHHVPDSWMMIRSHCLHPNFMKGYHPHHVPDSCSMSSSGDGEGKEDILGVSQEPGKKNRQGINTCLKSAKLCYYPSPPTTRQLPANYPSSQAALMLSYFRLFSPIQCLFLPWKSSSIPSSSEEFQKAGVRLLEVVS